MCVLKCSQSLCTDFQEQSLLYIYIYIYIYIRARHLFCLPDGGCIRSCDDGGDDADGDGDDADVDDGGGGDDDDDDEMMMW